MAPLRCQRGSSWILLVFGSLKPPKTSMSLFLLPEIFEERPVPHRRQHVSIAFKFLVSCLSRMKPNSWPDKTPFAFSVASIKRLPQYPCLFESWWCTNAMHQIAGLVLFEVQACVFCIRKLSSRSTASLNPYIHPPRVCRAGLDIGS